MNAAKLRFRLLLFILSVIAVPAMAHDVTITGNVTFASLDGSPLDHDHVANGVFTVNDGNLIVNGTISCNDSGGSSSACAMAFNVGHDLVINAGGALYAENRTGTGTGGAITLTVGHDLILHGASGSLPAAIVSSNAKNSTASIGGAITANVAGAFAIESGATIDSGASNARGGAIDVTAGGAVSVDGNVFSGPSRTLLSTRLTGQALDGGTANQIGGGVSIRSTSYLEPAVTIGSNANVISQGESSGSGPVSIEGCGIVVKGLVASLGKKDSPARVVIRSGKALTIDARDLGASDTSLGRLGRVRADAPAGSASQHTVDLFADGAIQILGPASTSSSYVLSALPGPNDAKSDGGAVHVISLSSTVAASGNVVDNGRTASGDGGGSIVLSAKGDVNLDGARLRAVGDSNTNNVNRNGGSIAVRSFSGNVIWTNGSGDVTPTGSQVSAAQAGTISLSACGTITTSGSTFPVNGSPVGPFPTTSSGVCSPTAPSLPNGEPALPVCNNPPVPVATSASTLEDHSVTITMTAVDPDGNPVTFTIDTPPAHGTLSAIFNPTPTSAQVTYTPAADYNGSDSFVFKADDGNGGTATATVSITITPVNDAPSFNVGSSPQTSLEDAGPQFVSPWSSGISAGPADEQASQHVTFTITSNSNPSLFSAGPSVTPSGALTYTAAPNAYGTASLSVVAHDDGGTANGGVDTSAPQNFTITIIPVNDPPSFTKGADVTVNEDSGAYSQAAWATSISAGPNETQTVNFVVTTNNDSLFSALPAVAADGTLTFTPAANGNGVATVTVVAHDNGGTANGGIDTSAAQTFTITVTAVNDPPSFTSGGNVAVLEDFGPYSAAWATAISPGPPDESSQTVTFTVSNDNNALFSVQPSIASNGTLTFTPAADANGAATVTVAAHDNGGTANGGNDTSASQTFTIAVTAVNDPPSFTKGADQTALEDAGAQSVAGWATSISAGPANESSQTVTFTVTNNNNALFSVQPAVASNGTLTYTSAPNANGTATVAVVAHDDGGTANGGVDTSASQTFTITITAVNDPPSFTGAGNVSVLEDSGPYAAVWATAISAGPPDEGSQSVTFTVSNSNGALFSAQPSIAPNGTLTFTPAADANGTATVTVTAHDDGGTANGGVDTSAPVTFTINVQAVNDAPSFVKGPDVNVTSTDGPQTYANWATSISAGPSNESSQTVNFVVSTDDPSAFSAQPAVSPAGTLTFATLAAAPTVTVHVTVFIHDNGGTANGGVDSSASQTFNINITHGNQPPVANADSFSAIGNTELRVGTGPTSTPALVTVGSVLANDTDSDGPSPLSVSAYDATTFNGGTVSMNPTGTFNYLPPAGFVGADVFHYTVTDGAAVTVGTVTINVNNRVWYVNAAAGGTQTGRSTEPFASLTQAETASFVNDTVYVAQGTYSTGITLQNSQRLIGSGVALTVGANTLAAATVRPLIGGVTLASSNFVTGLNVSVSSSAVGIIGSVISGGTIDQVNVSGGYVGLVLISSTGTFNVSNVTLTPAGIGLSISGGSATVNASNLDITTTTGTGILGNAGTLNITAGADGSTIATTGGTAVDLSNMALGVSLRSINATGGTNAVNLNTTTGMFAVTGTGAAGSGGTIQGTTGVSVNAVNASGITLTSMNINNSALQGVLVQNSLAGASSVDVETSSFSGNFSNAVQTVNSSTGSMTVIANGNTFTSNNAAVVAQTTKGSLITKMTNNVATFSQSAPFVVSRSSTGNSLSEATITGNTVGTSGVANSGAVCGGGCLGISVQASGSNAFNLLIANNAVYQVDAIGIRVLANQGSSQLNSTITNNVVAQPVAGAAFGINVQSGSLTADTTAVCSGITGNTVGGGWSTDIFVRNTSAGSTFSLPGYAGASTDTTAVANFLLANNTIGTAFAQRKTTTPANGFSGGSPCTLPAP